MKLILDFKKLLLLLACLSIFPFSSLANPQRNTKRTKSVDSARARSNVKKRKTKISVDAKTNRAERKRPTQAKNKKALTLEQVSQSIVTVFSGFSGLGEGVEGVTEAGITTGTGFFISKNLLVTNSHVVANAFIESGFKYVFIKDKQNDIDKGIVLLEDKKNDLAIIKTIFKNTHHKLRFGKYSKVKMGDDIFVLGSPKGLGGTLSKGIVSAKRKEKGLDVLQITAAISEGSSGSPVLSKNLKVIAVVVATFKKGQNLNFAVPITYLKKLIKKNKKKLVAVANIDLSKPITQSRFIASKPINPKNLKTDLERAEHYHNKKNYEQSLHWYKKDALQGDALAQFNLGVMYNKGQGVLQNQKQAVHWYKKSALQGNALAQYNLGLMYVKGQGVLQDYISAYAWWNLAASNGFKGASKSRDLVTKSLSPSQLAQAQQLSQKLLAGINKKRAPASSR